MSAPATFLDEFGVNHLAAPTPDDEAPAEPVPPGKLARLSVRLRLHITDRYEVAHPSRRQQVRRERDALCNEVDGLERDYQTLLDTVRRLDAHQQEAAQALNTARALVPQLRQDR